MIVVRFCFVAALLAAFALYLPAEAAYAAAGPEAGTVLASHKADRGYQEDLSVWGNPALFPRINNNVYQLMREPGKGSTQDHRIQNHRIFCRNHQGSSAGGTGHGYGSAGIGEAVPRDRPCPER